MTDRQSTTRVRSGSKGIIGDRPEAVRIKLLGGFKVSVGSRTIERSEWRLRKAAILVKLLALSPGHRLHREQAMDLLWPDSGRQAASNSLRKTLHGARRTLDPDTGPRYLASEDESLVLCPSGDLWVDAEAFEEAAAAARRAKEPAAYRAAIELYAGELLPGDRYEEWAESRRGELRRLYLSLLVELAGLYEERGEYERGIEALQRVVAEEPTHEEAHIGLMRLYALSGRQAEALAQYERLEESLTRELGAEPNASSRALREEIAAGRFPPSHRPVGPPERESLNPLRHNLPAPRTSFVGRDREVVEVKRALAMTRLLTLTGAGGVGKTRLALEVARDLVGAYSNGAWLVELAPVSEPDLVPQTVAGILRVKEQPGQPLPDTLVEALRGKEMLVVVDNCEHLVEAAATLVDALLAACPRLRVLATSREPLGLNGEAIKQVSSLSVPDTDRLSGVGDLTRYDAVRLFMDRVRLRLPDFGLTPENVKAIAEVCRRLEGIPLAIELTAPRLNVLRVDQVAQKLGDSLGVLSGGPRTGPSRQRTMRATLAWSHELLSEGEQKLFGRLSVFAGGWTLEAAEAVTSGEGIGEGEVLDLLSGLVDKSLVVAETTRDGGVRYRMLELVRQYALEKLEVSSEAETVRRRHAAFFLALTEEADPALRGPDEGAWLDRLEAEHDNFRAVFSWSLEGGDSGLGLRMAAALWRFWVARGYYSEGTTWLEGALAEGGTANPMARAGTLIGLGGMLSARGDFARAEEHLVEAHSLYERLGDRGGVAEVLNTLGWVTFGEGDDPAQAKVILEEGLAAARESGNRRVIPSVLNGLALIAVENGDFELARTFWGEALLLNRDYGRPSVTSSMLFNMGYIELATRDVARAMDLFAEALSLSQELRHKHLVAGCLLGLGMSATLRGEPRRAEALIKEGLAIDLELESKTDNVGLALYAEFLEGLAEAAGALTEDLRAVRLWGAAAALRETLDWPWWTAERLLHEPQLLAFRSRLDEGVWEKGFEEGQAMMLEEAIEYALSEEQSATPTPQALDSSVVRAQQPTLTRREEVVATLVAQGMTNRQIASELVISEHTAATHIRRILKKLGLSSRSQLSAWVTGQGLPSLDLG